MPNQSLKTAATKVEKAGRRGDTVLAHLNPREAKLLKALGGSGTKNPKTGLREFFFSETNGNRNSSFDSSRDGQGLGNGPEIGSDFGGANSGSDGSVIQREKELRQFGGPTQPASPDNSKGELSNNQALAGKALRLAAGLVIPGAGVVTGAARGLEALFGPSTLPSFIPTTAASLQDFRRRPDGQLPSEFETRSGAATVAQILDRSENVARTRIESQEAPNLADAQVNQNAALARRRDQGNGDSRGGTVLTRLRGLLGGVGFGKKKLLGR